MQVWKLKKNISWKLTGLCSALALTWGNGLDYCKIRDLNGNTIGQYEAEDIPVFEEASDE